MDDYLARVAVVHATGGKPEMVKVHRGAYAGESEFGSVVSAQSRELSDFDPQGPRPRGMGPDKLGALVLLGPTELHLYHNLKAYREAQWYLDGAVLFHMGDRRNQDFPSHLQATDLQGRNVLRTPIHPMIQSVPEGFRYVSRLGPLSVKPSLETQVFHVSYPHKKNGIEKLVALAEETR